MSKTTGKLFHRGNEKELRERSDWDELSHDERKELGKLGWFETESLYPPDRYWDGEIENGVPHGQGTFYIPNGVKNKFWNGSKFVGTYKNGNRDEGTFTWKTGNTYTGSYKDNKKWNGEMYYKENDETIRFENGEDMTKKENLEEYKKHFQEKKKKQE
jgi:hypothetical protein